MDRKGRHRHPRLEGHRSRHCKTLAAEGASVVVNYASSREGADRVVARIADAGGKSTVARAVPSARS
jgi:NAD(P)-dependent dehydrogenase (short-subunit alcohol dehydrogenase family)